ncbi:hypothetical protein JXA85_05110 [Candidatus Woesearchaeota archaeon]|nr:hypothetical protein [Candidatus Woesearchaeota archaeon]
MQKLTILNKKEKEHILKKIEEQWGAKLEMEGYAFLKRKDGKIYIENEEALKVDFSKLRVDSLGMYFAEESKGFFRLSIEGSQLVGPHAKKNVVELNDSKLKQWMKGVDLEKTEGKDFVIIKNNGDFFGCGRITKDKLLNYFPKIRRIMAD